jgi:hypothetical protein
LQGRWEGIHWFVETKAKNQVLEGRREGVNVLVKVGTEGELSK